MILWAIYAIAALFIIRDLLRDDIPDGSKLFWVGVLGVMFAALLFGNGG